MSGMGFLSDTAGFPTYGDSSLDVASIALVASEEKSRHSMEPKPTKHFTNTYIHHYTPCCSPALINGTRAKYNIRILYGFPVHTIPFSG